MNKNKVMSQVYKAQRMNRKRVDNEINEILPSIYASICLALHNSGVQNEDIEYLIAESQRIWTEHNGTIADMVKQCEEETGICLMRGDNES